MEHSENLSLGYVKLHRSITNKSWYKKPDYFLIFCHLMMQASHSGYETFFNGNTIVLKPGQLVTGRKKLKDQTGISESKVQRILKFFESEQQIEQLTTSTCRLITITNWGIYQQSEQQIEQRINNEQTTGKQRVNTIQEGYKNDNNEKNDKNNTGKSFAWFKNNKSDVLAAIEKEFPYKDAEAAYIIFLEKMEIKNYRYNDYLMACFSWIREERYTKFPNKPGLMILANGQVYQRNMNNTGY